MESQKLSDNFNEISGNVKDYVRLKIDFLKLTLTEKLSLIISALLISIILFLVFLFISMFVSLAFIFWFRDHAGPLYAGALIVAGFYLLVGVIVFFMRNKIFIDPLVSKISKILLEEEDEEK
jgi:ABC-type multidrug transport system fused ATPase/permease subunit